MIVDNLKRKEILISAGVPKCFLDVVDFPDEFEMLKYLISAPCNFYYHLPPIVQKFSILKGFDVVPIYENGNTYHVLLINGTKKRYIRFELEQDEIYKDYGSNFNYLLADLLIEYYEFAVDLKIETLIQYGVELGFIKSKFLFESLEQADKNDLRKSFELDKAWRKKNIPKLIDT